MDQQNGVVKSTFLGREYHGIMTFMIHLDLEVGCQGFGGYDLRYKAYGIAAIEKVLSALEVRSWEDLKGTPVRVKGSRSKLISIGHFHKDKWFSFEEMKEEDG